MVNPPRCIFVTGPSGPGRLKWIDESISKIQSDEPGARCALLLAETGRLEAKRFAGRGPQLEVHCLVLPCLCCPALADLPGAAQKLAELSHAERLWIELPALPAAGLLAEFDRRLGWPREVVVWLSRTWARARQAQSLSVFQTNLLALADRVVEEPAGEISADAGAPVTELSLNPPPPS